MSALRTCPACAGEGHLTCPDCDGEGCSACDECDDGDPSETIGIVLCSECGGEGEDPNADARLTGRELGVIR